MDGKTTEQKVMLLAEQNANFLKRWFVLSEHSTKFFIIAWWLLGSIVFLEHKFLLGFLMYNLSLDSIRISLMELKMKVDSVILNEIFNSARKIAEETKKNKNDRRK